MLLILAGGCEGEESQVPDSGAGYFPLGTGVFQIYDVVERRYQVATDPDEFTYQLRTEIVDSFPSDGGNVTYVMHRSKRQSEADLWEMLDTWSVRTEASSIVVAEGNTAFVKLALPVREGDRWDGNAYNAKGKDEYRILSARKPYQLNDATFDDTVIVEQERNEDPIVFRDMRMEVYAANVGLIYREFVQLDYCTAVDCLGLQKIDEGIEIKMTITEYGRQ